ncbi:MAG: cytochrome C oxidase subunit IV [Gemmatimonadetes bacterium]|nr:cytochrome C oxidase subunit IV [Gemmatimonadota bacterium]
MSDHSVAAHADHEAGGHAHPTWKEYKWVALWLFLITVVEVWVYYIPAFVATKFFVPALLIMSAVKFVIVVMFYMHLKYDSPLFKRIFSGLLAIAMGTLLALLFLFGKVKF